MTVFEFNQETEALLRSKGLRCICQLCDCGLPHKHQGCRRLYPKHTKSNNDRNNIAMKSDYQSRFGETHSYIDPPKPIRPIEKPRNPNPPPMDLRTENKMAFRDFGTIEKSKPCKLQHQIEKLNSGQFEGKSVYEESYPGHQPQRTGLVRPQTVIKQEGLKRSFETEYNKGYSRKETTPQKPFFEKPTEANSLLYPGTMPVAQKSLKNSVHDGRVGMKAETCFPHKSSVQLGNDDEFDYSTTKSIQFQKYDDVTPVKSKKPVGMLKPRGKFNGKSSNSTEFQYDEVEATKARGQLCTEYPSLIKLSMDAPSNFNTVTSMSYNNWNAENFKKEKTINKNQSRYTPPKEKFQAHTQNQADFQNFGLPQRMVPYKPVLNRKSSAKIEGKSSYGQQFPNHGNISRVLYGDQHEDNLQLPPKDRKLESSTVMRNDYKNNKNVEKCKPFKPLMNSNVNGGEFHSATEYKSSFKLNAKQECIFPNFLVNNQMNY